jgi:hypothetical protein
MANGGVFFLPVKVERQNVQTGGDSLKKASGADFS